MAEDISNPLLALVKEQNLVDDLQYEEVVGEFKRSGKPVFQILQDFGIMDADNILEVMANHLGAEVVSLKGRDLPGQLVSTIPANTAKMYRCVPIEQNDGVLRVAFEDPLDPTRVSELGGDEDLAKEVSAVESAVGGGDEDEAAMIGLADAAPIVRFVNLVLLQAVQDRASDIHFEPFETEFRIRYRVDGALYEMSPPPKHLALPVVSRIKVMANLNISERRLPQDGRINFSLGKRQIDLRVSTLPTQFGESVVLRVLDRSAVNLEIESLGFPKYLYDYVTEAIQRPNGIFVVTGPTGCGKTTTLYSCLRRVNTIDSKLLTAEDPVEYDIEGIMQVAINEGLGLT